MIHVRYACPRTLINRWVTRIGQSARQVYKGIHQKARASFTPSSTHELISKDLPNLSTMKCFVVSKIITLLHNKCLVKALYNLISLYSTFAALRRQQKTCVVNWNYDRTVVWQNIGILVAEKLNIFYGKCIICSHSITHIIQLLL